MKLVVNDAVVAEAVDAEGIRQALRDLPPDDEAIIALYESDEVFMQAGGTPTDGFTMGYYNQTTGIELVSTNSALKTASVMRVFNHFLAGDSSWRSDVGWRPLTAKASAAETRAAYRRGLPIILAFAFFAVAIVPLAFATGSVLDTVVFMPMCARLNPDVSHYSHGSYSSNLSDLGGSSVAPTCWYTDNSNVPLEDIIGGSAFWLDLAGRIAQFMIPVVIIVAILFVAFRLFRKSPAHS
jgi:hypothetical protein